MSKKLIIVIASMLMVILILLLTIIRTKKPKEETDPKKLVLTYDISAGIPFRWEYEVEDESIVVFDKSYVVSDENKNGLVGGKVVTNYVFKGLKPGKTKITFTYVNFTTDEKYEKDEYTVLVDSDLNISIVK